MGCQGTLVKCYSWCASKRVVATAADAIEWAENNPLIVGTVLVIGGITFIVVTGGNGLPMLAPVLAL